MEICDKRSSDIITSFIDHLDQMICHQIEGKKRAVRVKTLLAPAVSFT